MESSLESTTSRPVFANAPRLSPWGLAVFIVGVIGSTFAIVVVARLSFPEVISEPLPVTILLDGYASPEQVDASIKRFELGEGEILEPYVTVRNDSDAPISSLYMRVNRSFLFHSAEPLAAGSEHRFYLSRFVEADGTRFWPHRYPLDRIEVRGRLPNLKQAIRVVRMSELGTANTESAGH